MEENEKFIEQLYKVHDGNWKSFFKIYNPGKSFIKSLTFKLAIFISIIVQIVISLSNVNSLEIFQNLLSRNLSIIPNILGFAIGAYALLISGFSDKILMRIAKINLKNNILPYNSFQKTSAVFGMAIFVMAVCLLVNYLIQIIIDTNFFYNINISECKASLINSSAVFILNILSIYTLLLLFNTIINLFAFSQFVSAIITLEKKENQE